MTRPSSTLIRSIRRGEIIRRHRKMLLAAVMRILPEDEVPRVFDQIEFDEERTP